MCDRCIYIYTYMDIRKSELTEVYVEVYVYIHVCVCVCVCVYIHIHKSELAEVHAVVN